MPGVSTSFVGDQTSLLNFYVDGVILPPWIYLIVTAYDVHNYGHRILINGQDLPGFDIPPAPGRWQTWMSVVPIPLIQKGYNTIQIKRDTSTGDNFAIGTVAIHWREIE